MGDVPLWKGQPITPGWWWLQFSDQPGPRYWDGTFWTQGSYFAGAEDYADFPILGPCPLPRKDQPMHSDLVAAFGLFLMAVGFLGGAFTIRRIRERRRNS